jgi:hypothetical protein
MKKFSGIVVIALLLASCQKKADISSTSPNLIFTFRFDSTQQRLNNLGQPSVIPAGNAAQSPVFNTMSAHYVELAPAMFTPLGAGAVLYRAPETTAGGSNAIDFEKSAFAGNGQMFYKVPISGITPGEYEWLRVSLAYQNYDIKYRVDTTISGISFSNDYTGTAASFIGFNTYVKNLKIKTKEIAVNANKKQGFLGFETTISGGGFSQTIAETSQAPEGATTVVNPLFATSPVPPGSCVVTGAFAGGKLKITGTETRDITVEVSLSTNKSFEWKDTYPNGKWDVLKGEPVIDMGIRGMIPSIK